MRLIRCEILNYYQKPYFNDEHVKLKIMEAINDQLYCRQYFQSRDHLQPYLCLS